MKFLFCSDGSKQAENAVRFGSIIAAACQAEITLLGIVEQPGLQDSLHESLRRHQQILLEKHLGVELTTRSGEPVTEILKQISQNPYDLVLIGAVHKSTKGAYWKSAKAYKLIKMLPVPVLVVVGHPQQLAKMLICTGGTPEANKAVEFAGKLAGCLNASVSLLHVFAQPPALYPDLIARLEDVDGLLKSGFGLARTLNAQKEILDSLRLRTEVKLRHGPVVWEMLAEIHEGKYDLVTTGFASSPGRFRTYFMGDVTRELINRAECPILVVRSASVAKVPEGMGGLIARVRRMLGQPELPTRSNAS